MLLETLPVALALAYLALYYEHIPKWMGVEPSSEVLGHDVSRPNLVQANASLGFSSITAVSMENVSSLTAWRQEGLRAAANYTGLDISIHSIEQANILLAWYAKLPFTPSGHRLDIGFVLSAKSHLEVLHRIIDKGEETALILEDDADWDVRIREQLSPDGGISILLRSFDESPDSNGHETPYGLDWDILFIGHCGHEAGLRTKHRESFKDPTVPDLNWVRSHWDSKHYGAFLPSQRKVFQSATALCTFGYAVTQKGARRITELYDFMDSFDGVLMKECRKGNLHCNVVAPELIHHQRSEEAVSPLTRLNQGLETRPSKHFFTMNIEYSARCNAQRGEHDHGQPGEKWIKCPPSRERFLNEAS